MLILDSPTVGVDIRNKQGIYEVISGLAAQGVAILLISDEVPEVYYNSDRILHMRNGEIVGEYVPGKRAKRRWRRRSMRSLVESLLARTEAALVVAILIVGVIFSMSSPYFLTASNLVNLVEAYSVTTILAAGVFVVLVWGGIDVSFTATAAATQYWRLHRRSMRTSAPWR